MDTYLESVNGNLPGTLTASLPKKTSAGDLAVVDNGRHMAWARLGAVTVDEKSQEADLIAEDAWLEDDSGEFFLTETTILAHFKTTARLKDWQVNNRTLTGNRIPLSTLPAALEKGRSLMVENTDDPAAAFAATVAAVDATKSPVELVLSQDLPAG